MSEKVLGFKKENALITCGKCDSSYTGEMPCHEEDWADRITIIRKELVPVVSVEELEKELREREKKIWQGTQTLIGHEFDIEKVDVMKDVANWEINHIRSWAKNQVLKK